MHPFFAFKNKENKRQLALASVVSPTKIKLWLIKVENIRKSSGSGQGGFSTQDHNVAPSFTNTASRAGIVGRDATAIPDTQDEAEQPAIASASAPVVA